MFPFLSWSSWHWWTHQDTQGNHKQMTAGQIFNHTFVNTPLCDWIFEPVRHYNACRTVETRFSSRLFISTTCIVIYINSPGVGLLSLLLCSLQDSSIVDIRRVPSRRPYYWVEHHCRPVPSRPSLMHGWNDLTSVRCASLQKVLDLSWYPEKDEIRMWTRKYF